jgi:hypothetical protein
MIKSYLIDGVFGETDFNDFGRIYSSIEKHRKDIWKMPIEVILNIFDELGKSILLDRDLESIDGINYLCLWLRKKNLKDLIKLNLGDIRYLDNFVNISDKHKIKAQPRGVVCHWIAGNIPTLAIFSLVQSLIGKNGNILKVSEESASLIISILKKLNDIKVSLEREYLGKDLLKVISIVSFSSSETSLNKEFSLIADCKVIWGGKQAVEQILSLPQKEHCETNIFGPKYSFGVFDREYIEEKDFLDELSKSVLDIIAFDQMGCSSPHVIFFEKSRYSIHEIGERLADCFKKITKKYPKRQIDPYTAIKILNIRAKYYLDPDKDIIAEKRCDWTILIDQNICLEEPVQSRTIFIKEIQSVDEAIPLITRKVQTIGIGIKDEAKKDKFCLNATYHGVARCVSHGLMNNFESPWDGLFFIHRLVYWATMK